MCPRFMFQMSYYLKAVSAFNVSEVVPYVFHTVVGPNSKDRLSTTQDTVKTLFGKEAKLLDFIIIIIRQVALKSLMTFIVELHDVAECIVISAKFTRCLFVMNVLLYNIWSDYVRKCTFSLSFQN